jgi:hypothetical protein
MLREHQVNMKVQRDSRQLKNANNKRFIGLLFCRFNFYCSLTTQYAPEGGEIFICI